MSKITIKFNKSTAKIKMSEGLTNQAMSDGIALLILALYNNQNDTNLGDTIGHVLDSISSIKGKGGFTK